MPEHDERKQADGVVDTPDRRRYPRVDVNSLSYLELGDQNGGVILNISQGGLALHAAEIITGGVFPKLRFRLPKSQRWLQAAGKLAWEGICQKEVGIQFTEMSDATRELLNSWIETEGFGGGAPAAPVRFDTASPQPSKPPSDAKTPLVRKDPVSQFDAMFPSETSLPPAVVRPRRSALSYEVPDPAGDVSDAPIIQPLVNLRRTEPQVHTAQTISSSLPLEATPAPGRAMAAAAARGASQHGSPSRSFGLPGPAVEGSPQFRREMPSDFASVDASLRTSIGTDASNQPGLWFPPSPGAGAAGPARAAAAGVPFAGLGYQPVAFEEPTGRGWIAVAMMLVAILAVGVTMSVGPDNLWNLYRRDFLETLRVAGPPPPAGASELPPTPPPITRVNPETSAQASPAATPPATSSSQYPSASATLGFDDTSPRGSAGRGVPSASDDNESPEDTEAKVRQFQIEHSGRIDASSSVADAVSAATPRTSPSPYLQGLTASLAPLPASSGSAVQTARPSMPAQVTPSITPPVTAPAAAPTTLPAMLGSVAISSHFESIPGQESYSTGSLQVGQLAYFPQPSYPVEAARAHVEGTVALRILVDQTGTIESVRLAGGPALLAPAAINAVRQWRYRQTLLNGRPVGTIEDVAITFRLGNSAASPR